MADKGINEACVNNDSLERFTIVELKGYLSNRGQTVSGNKRQLIERVKGANRLGLVDINVTKAEDDIELFERKVNKLTTPLGEVLVHPTGLKLWSDDLSSVPDFYQKDIYNYIVLKMNCKKQLKSRVFYEDGHVHSVQICEIDENSSHCYVKCKVLPSLPSANKKNTPDYDVWVMMSKVSGCINSAECNCTAGEGEACNHIAALLYAIADVTEKKINGKLAPTSQKCKWNNPRKRKLSPKKAENVLFRKHTFDREAPANKCIKVFDIQKSTVNVERFRDKLISNKSKAGWLTNFVKDTGTVKEITMPLPLLHNIKFQFSNHTDLKSDHCKSRFVSYFEKLKISEISS
ncbi:uncharacterized protein LOC132564697, partial [Ylistrum balloti]|uniref:uncharacterized protein LOC132564697 n=1 Tax=Ylistrum balloti TaxID=509963 RepID=UPI002905D680